MYFVACSSVLALVELVRNNQPTTLCLKPKISSRRIAKYEEPTPESRYSNHAYKQEVLHALALIQPVNHRIFLALEALKPMRKTTLEAISN
jgi:hypothetical protein